MTTGSCPRTLGPLHCLSTSPHEPGHGCTFHSTSGVPDRHEKGDDE